MAGDDSPELERRPRVNREHAVRTLTFWLRPEFVLRVVNRFQKVAGFDRSIALASGALTAVIPLTILTSAVSSQLGGRNTAERIIDRYELTGGGAEAVKDIFAPPSGTSTTLGIIGFFFLIVAVSAAEASAIERSNPASFWKRLTTRSTNSGRSQNVSVRAARSRFTRRRRSGSGGRRPPWLSKARRRVAPAANRRPHRRASWAQRAGARSSSPSWEMPLMM